ncbi:tRNA (adenosine(37)-N6)-dimethylallyltransferase MiaA [Lentisphaerota bacterium ZTH]|nr:tRNA (adenosine(37)-N6)-dimethylallyltransferase MiaA [Lentisphaerota bacterium]WET06263.1 tRNA (adenosine(37)-N6)-dimethylallyltransferase MiaA [Lentisphaerota bacterium ZTH]
MNRQKPLLAVIMGPTASGKSSLALQLAADFDGEIISADSMQIYKGLDIGTAKPSRREMEQVRHHLVDIYDIDEKLDVYRFVKLAGDAVSEIHSRGKLPILAGGTGFYIRSLLYGLDLLPGDEKLRAELDAKYDSPEGYKQLQKIMRKCDPEDFRRWEKHRRKLIRALEVFTLTGKSITELQTMQQSDLNYRVISWNLCWDRTELRRRIEKRTAKMLRAGWIEEAAAAIKAGILESPTAHQVLGYREIKEYLEGTWSFETTQQRIVTRTWQYARRQITWFKNQHPETEVIHMPVQYSELREKFAFELNSI